MSERPTPIQRMDQAAVVMSDTVSKSLSIFLWGFLAFLNPGITETQNQAKTSAYEDEGGGGGHGH